MNMEQVMISKLNPAEKALYQKCLEKNPGLTEVDFLELRSYALQAANPGAKTFFKNGGIIMEEKPDADTQEELKEQLEIHS